MKWNFTPSDPPPPHTPRNFFRDPAGPTARGPRAQPATHLLPAPGWPTRRRATTENSDPARPVSGRRLVGRPGLIVERRGLKVRSPSSPHEPQGRRAPEAVQWRKIPQLTYVMTPWRKSSGARLTPGAHAARQNGMAATGEVDIASAWDRAKNSARDGSAAGDGPGSTPPPGPEKSTRSDRPSISPGSIQRSCGRDVRKGGSSGGPRPAFAPRSRPGTKPGGCASPFRPSYPAAGTSPPAYFAVAPVRSKFLVLPPASTVAVRVEVFASR